MPRSYPTEAVKECFDLYLKHNGQQHDLIEAEMRRRWPGWSKQNLYSRGDKIGWIDRYGWEKAHKLKLAAGAQAATTSAETLFSEIEAIRKRLKGEIDAAGVLNRDLIYQHHNYCQLSANLLARRDAARDDLQSFVAAWERLLGWAAEIAPRLASDLINVSGQVMERARAEYGETAQR